MKILIEESVLRQALEALEMVEPKNHAPVLHHQIHIASITALRTALDASEKVEPVGVFKLNTETGYRLQLTKSSPRFEDDGAVELFTHPAPAVPKVGADKTGEAVIDPNCTCDEHGACAYCWNGKKHDTAAQTSAQQPRQESGIAAEALEEAAEEFPSVLRKMWAAFEVQKWLLSRAAQKREVGK